MAPTLLLTLGVAACEQEPAAPVNRPPTAGAIPVQTVFVGHTAQVVLSGYFFDPDGDTLTYSAANSQPDVAEVSVATDTLVVAALRQGEARVNVTATDPDGLSASQGVMVTVPNRAPDALDSIPAQEMFAGGVVRVALEAYFADPDGDTLTYGTVSSDTALLLASVSRDTLLLSGVRDGVLAVSVTATDPGGLSATHNVRTSVEVNPDRARLEALYHATDGPNWSWSDNWITDAPLQDWYGVEVNEAGRVTCLGRCANRNGLLLGDGWIPPELGDLEALEHLSLHTGGSGPIPPELGRLKNLEYLSLQGFIGLALDSSPIPPELGNLTALQVLSIHNGANLTGPIPPELGNLANLEQLTLWGRMTGPIPPEVGSLTALKHLDIKGRLSGVIPSEFGSLTNLEALFLWGGRLTGPIPSELGSLANLESLGLVGLHISGPIPPELRNLANLQSLYVGSTCSSQGRDPEECVVYEADLCAPSDSLQDWLGGFGVQIHRCGAGMAHLTQAVQSREPSVPLVAGEAALVRVLEMSPPVRARFYLDGTEVHVAEIPRFAFYTAEAQADGVGPPNEALVPGSVVRPGLEMVVEGEHGRIPAEGRQPVEIREMPEFNLTVIPFLLEDNWNPDDDTVFISIADSMAADPQGYWRLHHTADLLPIGAMRVTAHPPVVTDGGDAETHYLLGETGLIRTLEGGSGHWMGMGRLFGWSAWLGGWVSYSSANPATIAHELGHNFNLLHTPGTGSHEDPMYPHPYSSIGTWGYSFRDMFQHCGVECLDHPAGQHVDPETKDLMSYSSPKWISDYHFAKALEYRLENEGQAASSLAASRVPVRTLVVWGGADSTGAPFLEPAFVVDAPPLLPERGGAWTLEGWADDGSQLFALSFAMPAIADAGERPGGFAFAVPVQQGWEALARLTLSGPGGTATMDASTDRPISIWRDRDGQVRAILRRAPVQADGVRPGRLAGVDLELEVLMSRGIPYPAAWW